MRSRTVRALLAVIGAAEIAVFNGLPGGDQQAVQRELQQMLLRRYQAYRASGLAGIAPYPRGGGSDINLASDLRKATQAAQGLGKCLPKFHALLAGYPQAWMGRRKRTSPGGGPRSTASRRWRVFYLSRAEHSLCTRATPSPSRSRASAGP